MYMIFFFTMNIFLIIAPLCSQPWVCTPRWSFVAFSIDKHHQHSISYNLNSFFFHLCSLVQERSFYIVFFLPRSLFFFPYYYVISWLSFDWNVLIFKHSNLSYLHIDSFLSHFLSKSSRSAHVILRSY